MTARDMAAISVDGPMLLNQLRNSRITNMYRKQRKALQWEKLTSGSQQVNTVSIQSGSSKPEVEQRPGGSRTGAGRRYRPAPILKKRGRATRKWSIYDFSNEMLDAVRGAAEISREAGIPLSHHQLMVMREERDLASNRFYRSDPPVDSREEILARKTHMRSVRFAETPELEEIPAQARCNFIHYGVDGLRSRILNCVSAKELQCWVEMVPREGEIPHGDRQ